MKCVCERCALLGGALLARLPKEQVARLSCVFRTGRYRRNRVLYQEGDPAGRVLALRAGLVKLVKRLENSRERIVRVVFPGELFGLEALAERTYALSAVTLEESEVCATGPEELFAFLRQDAEIALEMVRFLVNEVGRMRAQVTEMSFKDARRKVATFLLAVTPAGKEQGAEAGWTTLAFSRGEISSLLELSAETVSRTFSALRRARLIEARGRRLTIRDRAGLEKAAQREGSAGCGRGGRRG